nr:MAG TPA: hypothetical protein [Caudoviricetes sp.]
MPGGGLSTPAYRLPTEKVGATPTGSAKQIRRSQAAD